jgi:serine/threonine protein kinase
MMLDARLTELLQHWDKLRSQGLLLSPEELCHEFPDLLEEAKKNIRALQTINSLHGTHPESRGPSLPMGVGLPVFGDYQVLGQLGQGGMSVVYQAYDRKRQHMVALKTLQRMDASSLYRLKQEFRALAEVAHPNLVTLYELVTTGPLCFLAMELVDGEHFLAYIRSSAGRVGDQTLDYFESSPSEQPEGAEAASGPVTHSFLSPVQYDRLRACLRQLAQGVSALHALGRLHRDIKPTNVMVTKEGRVVLLDFGLAVELDWAGVHQSTEQHVTGTIAYMAPEQAASLTQTPASDWYSVGVMLFQALTGRLPFSGTPFQVLMDKQKRDPLAPRELAHSIPEDLNNLCIALLSRTPEERPSAEVVLQRLGSGYARRDLNSVSSTSGPSRKGSFVGREPHLAELKDAFHAMCKGKTAVVRISGRSGAGKSMLAQHFLNDVGRHREAVVLSGKCYERESVPFKALDGLIDALTSYLRHLPELEVQALLPREIHLLTRVFPVLQRVTAVADAPGRAPSEALDPHDLRKSAFAALRELLARLGDRKPLVLFIDDLQWGDFDGTTQLMELFRPPDSPMLLLLVCYRSEDADTSPSLGIIQRALEKAGEALDRRLLAVNPLNHQEARALAMALLGRDHSAADNFAETIAAESGGNPYLVHVLVQRLTANVENAENPSLPEDLTLDQVLWSRIQQLPEQSRRLLEVIAVSGQPLRLIDACRAAGYGAEELGTETALRTSRLIRSTADLDEVETYHDRIRETILNNLPAELTQDLHRQIATVLESYSSQTARAKLDSKRFFDLAYHFDAAGDSGRALPYALELAD